MLTKLPISAKWYELKEKDKMKCSLAKTSTKDLVEELRKREGVEATIVEPHKDNSVIVNGPAVVFVVTD